MDIEKIRLGKALFPGWAIACLFAIDADSFACFYQFAIYDQMFHNVHKLDIHQQHSFCIEENIPFSDSAGNKSVERETI